MITQDELRQALHYDPVTGVFRWKVRRKRSIGAIAGSVEPRGYRRIRIDGRFYWGHRLAWLYVYGTWPSTHLDHKDGYRDHNWISNLRLASQAQNAWNARRRPDNTSGFKGVRRYGQKWQVRIKYNRREIHLGTFDTAEAAHAAYCVAATKYFGEFARVS